MSSNQLELSVENKYICHKLQVGEFVVDFRSGKLYLDHVEQATIPPKTLRTLEILILFNDRYLSNAELTNIYSAGALTVEATTRQQISKLRKLLNDNDKIKILREAKGYRLTLPVMPAVDVETETSLSFAAEESTNNEETTLSTQDREESTAKKENNRWKVLRWSALILVILFSAFGGYQYFLESTKSVSVKAFLPLTHMHGIELYPAVSDNGNWLLVNYLNPETNKWQIYLKDLTSESLLPLTSPDVSSKYPRWALQGKAMTYTQFSENACYFMLAELDFENRQVIKSTPVKSCNRDSLTSQFQLWRNGRGAYYLEEADTISPLIIYSYDFDAKTKWQVTSPAPTSKGDYFVNLSPSGERLAVLRSKHDFATELWVYNTKNWESHLVDTQNIVLFRVNWSMDEKRLIYKDDQNQLVTTDIFSGEKSVLKKLPVPFYAPVLLDDSEQSFAVIMGAISHSTIYRVDGLLGREGLDINQSSAEAVKPKKIRVVDSSVQERLVASARDGTAVAWVSERTGLPQVWLKQINAGSNTLAEGKIADTYSAEQKITALKKYARFTALSFSPDGKMLGGIADGHYFLIDLEKGSILWSQNKEAVYHNFSWCADSQAFYLSQSLKGHRSQIVVDRYTYDSHLLELAPEAFLVEESFDGRFLYAWNKDTYLVTRFDRQTQTRHQFDLALDVALTNNWSMTDSRLLLTRRFEGKNQLLSINHNASEFEILDPDFGASDIAAPANGNWLYFSKRLPGDTSLIKL